jgi:hypothetical protein
VALCVYADVGISELPAFFSRSQSTPSYNQSSERRLVRFPRNAERMLKTKHEYAFGIFRFHVGRRLRAERVHEDTKRFARRRIERRGVRGRVGCEQRCRDEQWFPRWQRPCKQRRRE